ncbi:hypothetical protein ACFV9E_36090 [Streptomyces sp. NPDC059835]|uniref:hypothetical protein n=1 Tax=Streptomyces sp. NPDC059835 TaxID=3346967 RepID=UPI00364AAADA
MAMPGALAGRLEAAELTPEAAALTGGHRIRRGQGVSVHTTATAAVHRELAQHAAGVEADSAAKR